ncbi:MAG: DUF1800 domain-containing protein [Sphingomonadaceae bacterium]|nr:DUF1800 domain-containing protein [Sphingomonadaceae bacterium]
MREELETGEVDRDAGGVALPDNIAFVAVPALALAACGSGGSPTPAPTPTPTPTPTGATPPQAARFLAQATMGSSSADIAHVQAIGFDGWLTEQFAKPRATTHWDWLIANGYNDVANINSQKGYDPTVWRQLITSDDQLRQRVAMALLDFLVVGIDGLTTNWKAFAAAAFLDVLTDNAFGNYRALIDAVSLNPAMGLYLTFLGNRKANAATGAVPDENYARELMQLFTLGLVQLNMDGTPKSGSPDTYTQDDVTGLARVFTGFTYASSDGSVPDRLRVPMIQNASLHETGTKVFLGTTIPAGTDGFASLKLALDSIFAHANVPPFISKQLIQRLVTSNPTPAYVGRVAAVFADNGSGVRGDLKAVVRAILLDSEARDDTIATGVSFGKLREPIMRLTNWARAFGVTSASNAWAIGDTSSSGTRLAESPGRSQSVFNFFRPGYTPPNTAIAAQGLVGPEFQITNEPSVVAYLNYMQTLIASGTGDVKANYTDILAKAADSQALIDAVNLTVAAGQVSAATLATVKAAVDSISATGTNGPINRVYTAILLVMATPEYIAQK